MLSAPAQLLSRCYSPTPSDLGSLLRMIPHFSLLFLLALLKLLLCFRGHEFRPYRPHREIPHRHAPRSSVHRYERLLQLEQRPARQRKLVLIRLIHGSYGIVEKRRTRLLDVIAENMRDRLVYGKTNHSFRARLERSEIMYIQPPWI